MMNVDTIREYSLTFPEAKENRSGVTTFALK